MQHHNSFSNKFFRALSLAQLVFWASLFVLSLPNLCLAFTEPQPLAARFINAALPPSLYALALTLRRNPGRMLWLLFPLVFLSAFQIVLLYLYGHSVIAVDMFLNLLTTNPGEAGELLDNLLPGIIFVIAVYVPTIVAAAVLAFKKQRLAASLTKPIRIAALSISAVALLCMMLCTTENYKIANDLYPANVFDNIRRAVQRAETSAHYNETSKDFTFGARSTHNPNQREVYILVIGETARAPQFALFGYHRDTTPRMSQQPQLYTFKKALTQSNTTHKSVPMLLSAVSATDYDSLYRQKGIIAAFKEAGFHTVFLSNQLPNHSFIDFLGKQADECLFIKENGSQSAADGYDEALLPYVKRVLQNNRQKQLIVLHTYGSHFEYRKRYPKAIAHFLPDDASEAKAANRKSLVNAYDNSIRNTDLLLHRLIKFLEAEKTLSALLYTSDHGENIFDDSRKIFLHASPIPSYFELHVPLMIWLSRNYQTAFPDASAQLAAHQNTPVATSLSVFHTFAQLGGLSCKALQPVHSLASPTYKAAPPIYLNDHDEAIPLSQIVIAPQDRLLLKQAGIPID